MTDIFTPNKKQKSLKRSTTKSKFSNNELVESEEVNEFKAISNSEPHFAKIYYQDRRRLKNISKNHILVYLELSFYSGYNTNVVLLNPSLKQQICDDLEIANSTLDNSLTELVKNQLVARIGKGTYLLNPFYLGKGNWSENNKIRKNIKYNIEYVDYEDENSPIKNITFDFSSIPNFIDKHAALVKNNVSKPIKIYKPKNQNRNKHSKVKNRILKRFFRFFTRKNKL